MLSKKAFSIQKLSTKHEILSTSLDLFIEKGFNNITMGLIAERANISRRTLYGYFQSKKMILDEISRIHSTELKLHLKTIYNKNMTGAENLSDLIDFLINWMNENLRQSRFNAFADTYYRLLDKRNGYSTAVNTGIIQEIFRKGKKDGSLNVRNVKIDARIFQLSLSSFMNELLLSSEQDLDKMSIQKWLLAYKQMLMGGLLNRSGNDTKTTTA